MWSFLLFGCEPPASEPPFALPIDPSPLLPAALRATWDGPAGDAELWAIRPGDLTVGALAPTAAAPQGWRLVSRREAADGADGLPIALLPPGEWAVRAFVDDRSPGAEGLRRGSELVVVEVPEPPPGLTRGQVERADPDRSGLQGTWLVAHQYAGAASPGDAFPAIYDADGEIVWWAPPDPDGRRAIRAQPTADGRSVLILWDGRGEDDAIERLSLDGTRSVRTPVRDATHDAVEGSDGTVAYLAYTYGPPGTMAEWPEWPVSADAVRVRSEGSTDPADAETLFDWLLDHPADPSAACDHVAPNNFVPGTVEWTHGNSLIADPGGDGYWALARHLDAIVHVGADGERRWELGGAHATLAPESPEAVFRHGHASHAWREDDGDHLLIFDNRTHDPAPVVSRVVELVIDADAGTYRVAWSLPDPLGRYTSFLGDARRLPNGNTLVDWTPWRELTEHAPDGEVVWRMRTRAPLGRVVPTRDLRP